MLEPHNILFASDLSVDMKTVFERVTALAICENAHIIILHVMEETPDYAEKIRTTFGENVYQTLKKEQKKDARNTLIGKNIDAFNIRKAVAGFFNSSIEHDHALIKEIFVSENGSVADEIVKTAVNEHCSTIVIGCRQNNLETEETGKNRVLKILKNAPVPVLVVPLKDK